MLPFPNMLVADDSIWMIYTAATGVYVSRPADWNDADNDIWLLAAGASGETQGDASSGGGGALAHKKNFVWGQGVQYYIRVGQGGASATSASYGQDGGDTYLGGTSLSNCVIGAKGGHASTFLFGGGFGAAATDCVGYDEAFSGGNGGNSVKTSNVYYSGGGGGAAGLTANGQNGPNGSGTTPGNGGASGDGMPGGIGGTPGTAGNNGVIWPGPVGPGGGGGGSKWQAGQYGGAGGSGAGGAGGYYGGKGGDGLAVIRYRPK